MKDETLSEILMKDSLKSGQMYSFILERGTSLRLIDILGGANVSCLLYNSDFPLERYNMPDTLKAQHIAHLTKGHVLYSDMGKILCSITEDSIGWHDTLGGVINSDHIVKKFGSTSYQSEQNDFYHNGLDNFIVELSKYGLGKKDIVSNLNFFSKVWVDAQGVMYYQEDHSKAGDSIVLRAEMNVLVILSVTPHPMTTKENYHKGGVLLEKFRSPLPGPDDFCRNSRPENIRGFINTENSFKGSLS